MSSALGTTALPLWPALLFGYLEPCKTSSTLAHPFYPTKSTTPVSLLLGAHAAISDPLTFTASQLPPSSSSTVSPAQHSPATTLLAYTLGSLFLVIAGYALTCTVLTRDPNVTKYYLMFAACGDIGHLLANYHGMGARVFWAWEEWNAVMWGNIAVTVFLFANRVATLGGVFGRPAWWVRVEDEAKKVQ
ncbi:hypothetical protein E8E13_003691 [Curvularia kusanoi]|uniref:DUF7704 domain-containing protein n=1 Tax=Curvularia kusanoi TaxID=90978 RepID=A0A9P4TKQ8_CURKU|nr:hypothetical protein E8E13_003691 [Curvularia kusanoi]